MKSFLTLLWTCAVIFCFGHITGAVIQARHWMKKEKALQELQAGVLRMEQHRHVTHQKRHAELMNTQRMTGTNEFARGWNAAMDNLQHHLKR